MKYTLIAIVCLFLAMTTLSIASDHQLTMGDAMATVQQTYGGKILSAQEEDNRFRIKLLTSQGEVMIVFVNRFSGQIE